MRSIRPDSVDVYKRQCLASPDAKLRHYDQRGMVTVRQFAGENVLALSEMVDDVQYTTLIYYADGYMRELYFEDGLQFQPEDGEKIIAVQDLQVTPVSDDLLRLVCISAEAVSYTHLDVYKRQI